MPSAPRNLEATAVNSTYIELNWDEPTDKNGILQGYRLYFMYDNITDVRTVLASSPHMEYTLADISKLKICLKVIINGQS